MNFSKIFFFFFIVPALVISGCKKENKKTAKEIPSINIEIPSEQAISLGDLKIYPILGSSKSQDDNHLVFAEAIKKRGFNVRRFIDGQGIYRRASTLFFANKTNQPSLVLLGEISQSHSNTFIMQVSREIPAKKITEIGCIQLSEVYDIDEQLLLSPLFPCPPTPLRDLLHHKSDQTIQWLREALPLINFSVRQDLNTIQMDLNLFGDEDEKDEAGRIPQENIGELENFLQRFIPIGENATGCLVTYRDTIIVSYYFAQANLFKKEWPYISTSIYLNQLMGYHPTEMSNYTPFIDEKTATGHIQKLWQQELVLPQDDAHRGEWEDGVPFYLVWF